MDTKTSIQERMKNDFRGARAPRLLSPKSQAIATGSQGHLIAPRRDLVILFTRRLMIATPGVYRYHQAPTNPNHQKCSVPYYIASRVLATRIIPSPIFLFVSLSLPRANDISAKLTLPERIWPTFIHQNLDETYRLDYLYTNTAKRVCFFCRGVGAQSLPPGNPPRSTKWAKALMACLTVLRFSRRVSTSIETRRKNGRTNVHFELVTSKQVVDTPVSAPSLRNIDTRDWSS